MFSYNGRYAGLTLDSLECRASYWAPRLDEPFAQGVRPGRSLRCTVALLRGVALTSVFKVRPTSRTVNPSLYSYLCTFCRLWDSCTAVRTQYIRHYNYTAGRLDAAGNAESRLITVGLCRSVHCSVCCLTHELGGHHVGLRTCARLHPSYYNTKYS